MNTKLFKRTIKIVLLVVLYLASLSVFFIPLKSINTIGTDSIFDEEKFLYPVKSANNDTNAPVITFIQPYTNNTTIKSKYYDIIVNITDLNPPLPGNVTLEISNSTTSLFNGSMTLNDEDDWFFTWDNITSYPNNENYSFKVTAKDSSVNENMGISEVMNVYLELSKSPGALNVLFYIIAVSVIIAGVLIYYNKKHIRRSSRTDIDRNNY